MCCLSSSNYRGQLILRFAQNDNGWFITHATRFMPPTSSILLSIYQELRAYYGPQDWWPTHGGGAWEIMLGAVLTQRTTWGNVELALGNVLRAWGVEGLSRPERVLDASDEELAALVRPAGYYNVKPRKVRNLARFVVEEGGIERLPRPRERTVGDDRRMSIRRPASRDSALRAWPPGVCGGRLRAQVGPPLGPAGSQGNLRADPGPVHGQPTARC